MFYRVLSTCLSCERCSGDPITAGIGQVIRSRSDDLLQVEHGSLYPALHRLQREGWIESEWGTTQNNQRAKFYRLTAEGKQQPAHEETKWKLFVKTMARVMRPQE